MLQVATQHTSLSAALGVGCRELIALVGGGGKTAALQLLVEEAVGNGEHGTLATTTTHMYLAELWMAAPLVLHPSLDGLMIGLEEQLANGCSAAAARSVGQDGKVVGLLPEWVDQIWVSGLVDRLIVEADGSRGAPLKAFAPDEPRVPAATTTVVQVAGMDAIGLPLMEPHVHRAQLLSDRVGSPVGSIVTRELFVQAVRAQHQVLRRRWPGARHVILLNKAERHEVRSAGVHLARDLAASSWGDRQEAGPDSLIVGSVRQRWFHRLADEADD